MNVVVLQDQDESLVEIFYAALDYQGASMRAGEQTRGAIGSLNDCNVAIEENTWDHLF